MNIKKNNNRRYYLHRKVKESGFRLKASLKTIFAPHGTEKLPKHALQLVNSFNYQVQLEIE